MLSSPRASATLHIESVLEDGTPALEAGANVENLAGVQRAFVLVDGKSNVLNVPVYVGEAYNVKSFMVHSESTSPF